MGALTSLQAVGAAAVTGTTSAAWNEWARTRLASDGFQGRRPLKTSESSDQR